MRPAETRVALHGLSVATSGDYLRCFISTARVTHTPSIRAPAGRSPTARVGQRAASRMPPRRRAVDRAGRAGLQDGLVHAERHGLAARFVQRTPDGFVEHLSSAFAAML
jgi:thiamine biosynthesis lipoprotein